LKPVRNYAFSEWAEYRDIIFIARKEKPKGNDKVKFGLIKSDLSELDANTTADITNKILSNDNLRDDDVDVKSFTMDEIRKYDTNLMWLCGVTDYKHHDILFDFVNKLSGRLVNFKSDSVFTGYRPDKNVSKIIFITRASSETRADKAFLSFKNEDMRTVKAVSKRNIDYVIEKKCLENSLRTPVGLSTMDISESLDYIAKKSYRLLNTVCEACDFKSKTLQEWMDFWKKAEREVESKSTNLSFTCRINPFSDESNLIAFFSKDKYSPSDQFNTIKTVNQNEAKAICVILNSIVFISQFFLSKEESTGRFIHVRVYDFVDMNLKPRNDNIDELVKVYNKYSKVTFPSLRMQLDMNFDIRYKEFWKEEKSRQKSLIFAALGEPIQPFPERLSMDYDVCKALRIPVKKSELINMYETIMKEMIIIRHLTSD
jgi:hypothetical protein